MTRGQAERLIPLLQEVLRDADLDWSDLTRIGVGIGPGNFTGIRISVAAARGLALGLRIPAIGVSSLEALTHGTNGPVVTSVDARAGKVYLGIDDKEPILANLDALPDLPRGARCIGFAADTLAAACDGLAADPAHPLPDAIALVAADRVEGPRPAPLYIRAPDAAPARPVPLSYDQRRPRRDPRCRDAGAASVAGA